MSSIGDRIRTRLWEEYGITILVPGDRYLVVMGRGSEFGGRQIYFNSYPENQYQDAYNESIKYIERNYTHMSLIDIGTGEIKQSAHIMDQDGVWVWSNPSEPQAKNPFPSW